MNKFQTLVAGIQSISEDSITPDLYKCADAAYQYYVSLFGMPKDASWSYEIITAPSASVGRDPFRRMYIVAVRISEQNRERRLASAAHEMYHRVTLLRKGLHRQHLWVDEMLAFLATDKFLRDYGLRAYCDAELKRRYAMPHRLKIETLKGLRRRSNLFGLVRSQYPPDFASTIAVLGKTLEQLVGWENICQLVHCRTWQDWIASLPQQVQPPVREIIQE